MKVKELIDILQKHGPEARVLLVPSDGPDIGQQEFEVGTIFSDNYDGNRFVWIYQGEEG